MKDGTKVGVVVDVRTVFLITFYDNTDTVRERIWESHFRFEESYYISRTLLDLEPVRRWERRTVRGGT